MFLLWKIKIFLSYSWLFHKCNFYKPLSFGISWADVSVFWGFASGFAGHVSLQARQLSVSTVWSKLYKIAGWEISCKLRYVTSVYPSHNYSPEEKVIIKKTPQCNDFSVVMKAFGHISRQKLNESTRNDFFYLQLESILRSVEISHTRLFSLRKTVYLWKLLKRFIWGRIQK